ncbi:putative secreted protein (plasmid) [Streptomyces glaucescens]|uniref:Putative secreted protein n=1 Tax=Streptomyces glaucescens TaxID=1907 RepID=A0A089Z9T5_STRGA|nr:putative secreted protein [Streptomyces glaucescens]
MPLCRRRIRSTTSACALAVKTSRDRIIPPPYPAQTPVWHVKAVMLRGSLPMAAICLPLLVIPDAPPPHVLPLTALFLTTAHGSVLVRQWIFRR